MAIFVTGATGYIGSHTVVELIRAGYDVVGMDNFSNSKPEVVEGIAEASNNKSAFTFYEGDVCNKDELLKVFSKHKIQTVIHFAGYKAVGESVAKPLMYYKNNLISTISLCEAMEESGVLEIVFSSSATVYGQADKMPITEDFPLSTSSPYGTTKLTIEYLLNEWANANSNVSVSLLRYFNPVGADETGLIGEDPNGIPNNLMPYICKVASGKLPMLTVFGDDYPTRDGSCIRDYIHVSDLAKGHIKAVEKMKKGVSVYNLGTGVGVSVLELVNAFIKVNNIDVNYKVGDRRAGDVTECYADCTKANKELGWRAEKSIEDICRDSFRWARKNEG